MMPIEKVAMATPRLAGGKLSSRIAWAIGCSAPPPMPCTIRHSTSISSERAVPHSSEPSVNSTSEAM